MAGYVYEIKKDQAFPFGGEGAVAMEDVSVPVEPLFNENDTCGEAVPRQTSWCITRGLTVPGACMGS